MIRAMATPSQMRYKIGFSIANFLRLLVLFWFLSQKSGVPDRAEEDEHEVYLEARSQSIGCGFSPFKAGVSPRAVSASKEALKPASMLPDLPLRSSAVEPAAFPISIMPGDNHSDSGAAAKRVGRAPHPATGGPHLSLQLQQQLQQQPPRKARRCWSPELHRRFVLALQQLGGAQGLDNNLQNSPQINQISS